MSDFDKLIPSDAQPIDHPQDKKEEGKQDKFAHLIPSNATPIQEPSKVEEDFLNPNTIMGAGLGAAGAGAGTIIHGLYGGAEDVATNVMANALQKAFGNNQGQIPSNTSSGQKWFSEVINKQGRGYTAPEGDVGVTEAAHSYNRQKSSSKITSKLEKKYGKSTPGRLSINGAEAFGIPETSDIEIPTSSFWDTEGGQLASKIGKGILNLATPIIHGALHGLNAAQQFEEARTEPDTASAALHGTSSLGSLLSIASHAFPEATAIGMRQIGNPLASVASTAAELRDIYNNKNYGQAPFAVMGGLAGLIPGVGLPAQLGIRAQGNAWQKMTPEQKLEIMSQQGMIP